MPFSEETLTRLKADAAEITGRYPRARSALLPLLYLVQAEEGYVSDDGMAFCAEVLGITADRGARRGDLLHDVQARARRRVPGRASAPTRPARSWAATRSTPSSPSTSAAGRRHGDGHHDIKSPDGKVARRAPRVQRGLRLRPRGDGQLGVLRQPDAAFGQAAGRRPAGGRRRAARPAARTGCAPGSRPTGSSPGSATARPPKARRPGPASLVGLKLAKERGWKAPEPAGGTQVTDTLTPVLTANWDQPDSFTLAGYERTGGYKALPQGAGDGAGRRDRDGEERRAARPRRRGLPDRREVVLHPAERRQAALPHGQRRRVRAGHVQGRPADDGQPARADRGHHHHLLRHQGRARVHLRARRGAARRPAAAARGRPGLRGGLPRQEHPRQRLRPRASWCTPGRAPTSAARRPRC